MRSPLRLSLREREEISRGLAGGESLPVDRATSWVGHRRRSRVRSPRMVDGGAIGPVAADKAAVRRARRPKRSKLASCASAPRVVEDKLELRWSPHADLGLAGGGVPRRSGDARVARDDLSVVVRAVTRRVTQGTDPLSAIGTHDASAARPHRDERSRPAARHAQHSGTARRSRRPGGARPLGRRPPHGQTDARDGDVGGTQDPLRHVDRTCPTVMPPTSSPTRSPRRSSSSRNSSVARSPGTKAKRWPHTPGSA